MKFDDLVAKIMKECEADGEPVTKEEAEEMAKMEMNDKANRDKDYAVRKKSSAKKERKIDEEKKKILSNIRTLLEGMQLNNGQDNLVTMKNETELNFMFNDNNYTIKLVKHRKEKKNA